MTWITLRILKCWKFQSSRNLLHFCLIPNYREHVSKYKTYLKKVPAPDRELYRASGPLNQEIPQIVFIGRVNIAMDHEKVQQMVSGRLSIQQGADKAH